MVERLKKLLLAHKALWLALFVFFAGTFTPLNTGKHFAFNLEPYPDGFFYTLPAWNFVHGHGFSMQFSQSNISTTVQPFYALLLVPFYALFTTPVAFYALNVVLEMITICFLYFLIKENTHTKWAPYVTVLFALLPAVLWLPAVPMAENLLLPLVTVTLWLWATKKIPNERKIILLLILQLGLFLTKYSAFTFLIPLNGVLLWQFYQIKQKELLKRYVFYGAGMLLVYLLIAHPSFILTVFRPQLESKTGIELTAFSLSYVFAHLVTYGKALLGIPAYFLWEKFTFLVPAMIVIPFAAVFARRQSIKLTLIKKIITVIIGLVFLQSFFYALDTRYLIAVLPMATLATALGLELILAKQNKLVPFMCLTFFALILIGTQPLFYKQLIGSNWLQRSVAWQAEAIKHLKNLDLSSNSYLITALPPYLFNFYYPNSPHLLPLSQAQEFMNIGQRPWGENINYQNLSETYRALIQQGKTVYITNAYITQQQTVITDFEHLKQNFNVQLVATDCQETCNVYQVLAR